MKFDRPFTRRSFDRRAFLRGLGTAALVAPVALKSAHALVPPRRNVVIFYLGGGMHDRNWRQGTRATGRLDAEPLKGVLSLLDSPAYRDLRPKINVIEGAHALWNKNARGDALFAHDRSNECALVCTHPDDAMATPSLDRRFAELLKANQDVPFASLQFCVSRPGGWKYNGRGEVSRNGAAALSSLFQDPIRVYEQVFMGVMPGNTPARPDTATQLERGILSGSLEQCDAVRKQVEAQLGLEAARRVSDQCDALRDMERRLISMPPTPAVSCSVPTRPAPLAYGRAATFHETVDVFRRLGLNALACGRTNVVLVELWRDQPDDPAQFQEGEFKDKIIHLYHFHFNNSPPGSASHTLSVRAREDLDRRTLEEYAKWVAGMNAQALLDDGLVIWASNEPRGDHSVQGANPSLIAGSFGGKVRTGQYLRLSDHVNFDGNSKVASLNEVYGALLSAAGAPTAQHGPAKYHRMGDLVTRQLLNP
jgi:hypothetical protein